MRFACWIPKDTDSHSEYVIFIAFTLQQWLRERASMIPYTYIVCLVCVMTAEITTMSLHYFYKILFLIRVDLSNLCDLTVSGFMKMSRSPLRIAWRSNFWYRTVG